MRAQIAVVHSESQMDFDTFLGVIRNAFEVSPQAMNYIVSVKDKFWKQGAHSSAHGINPLAALLAAVNHRIYQNFVGVPGEGDLFLNQSPTLWWRNKPRLCRGQPGDGSTISHWLEA